MLIGGTEEKYEVEGKKSDGWSIKASPKTVTRKFWKSLISFFVVLLLCEELS